MKFRKLMAEGNKKKFIIEEDFPEVGAYLYVYDGDECIYDSLQNNIALCQEIASDEFSVPLESWVEVREE